jgi:hypothetical protein
VTPSVTGGQTSSVPVVCRWEPCGSSLAYGWILDFWIKLEVRYNSLVAKDSLCHGSLLLRRRYLVREYRQLRASWETQLCVMYANSPVICRHGRRIGLFYSD